VEREDLLNVEMQLDRLLIQYQESALNIKAVKSLLAKTQDDKCYYIGRCLQLKPSFALMMQLIEEILTFE